MCHPIFREAHLLEKCEGYHLLDLISIEGIMGPSSLRVPFDNMQFMHEFTWLLMQFKTLIILFLCMLSYFEYILPFYIILGYDIKI